MDFRRIFESEIESERFEKHNGPTAPREGACTTITEKISRVCGLLELEASYEHDFPTANKSHKRHEIEIFRIQIS